MASERITGKVARVLNDQELVINRGSEHNIRLGAKFAVLDPLGEDIKDPETGEVIGSVHRPKVHVEVIRVEPKLSVAKTYKVMKINIGGQGPSMTGLSRMFEPPKWETKVQTFRADDAAWSHLDEAQSVVKVGDPVEEVAPGADVWP